MGAAISMVEFKVKIPWWLCWEPWCLLPWKDGGFGGEAMGWIAINSYKGKIRVGVLEKRYEEGKRVLII